MNGDRFDGLPGGDLIAQGLRDIAAERETMASLLVEIGSPNLARLGIIVHRTTECPERRRRHA